MEHVPALANSRTALPQATQAVVISGTELFSGFFFGLPELKGPFPAGGIVSATGDLAAVAVTNPSDSAVTANSGDVWAVGVDPNATYTPLTPRQVRPAPSR
jgi:hypothetical protein